MKVVTLEATAFWCDPHRANKFGKITMDAGRLSQDAVKMLREEGIKVNLDADNDPDSPDYKGYFVKPKSPTPVTMTDMEGKVLPANLFIGNGSKVIIGVGIKAWVHPPTQRSGKSLVWLNGKVKEFVAYDPDAQARAKADALLDQVSGEGFVFGESDSGAAREQQANAELDAMFGDASQ